MTKHLTNNIPQELRELIRWVGVKVVDGTKRPMQVNKNKLASVTENLTWGTFKQACKRVKNKEYDFIGFVFADDGYVGIDIDHAIDDLGFISDEAMEIIEACKSYTEISQSGEGIHIICKGDIPFKGKNNQKGFEIYKSNRFFCLTGNVICYTDIIEAQEGINLTLQKHFRECTRPGNNRRTRTVIWNNTWPENFSKSVPLFPTFTPVLPGSRHLSMVSYCGQLHTLGMHKETILKMALVANQKGMEPPLNDNEVEQVVESVCRYKRT